MSVLKYRDPATGKWVLLPPAGPPGPQGPRGATGQQGSAAGQGTVGPAGAVGDKGATGQTGTAGSKGATGPDGADHPTQLRIGVAWLVPTADKPTPSPLIEFTAPYASLPRVVGTPFTSRPDLFTNITVTGVTNAGFKFVVLRDTGTNSGFMWMGAGTRS